MATPFFRKFSIGLARLNAVHRVLIGLFFGIVSFFIFVRIGIPDVTSIMMAWDIFSLLMIIMCWVIFFNIPESKINLLAQKEDESRTVIFVIVVVSLLISLFGIAILLRSGSNASFNKTLHETVSMLGVALSWILLHTIFTIHYAHLFYDDDDQKTGIIGGGVDFPGEPHPDYLDFAYFSFVIGMTFQVSDVTISVRKIRRLALLHGIISFLYNTIIVALTISIISNLK